MKNYILQLAESDLKSKGMDKNIFYPLFKFIYLIKKWISVDFNGGLELLKVDLILTSRCTLNCKECTYLIPYYKKREDYSYELLKKDIDHLSHIFTRIYQIVLVGGEPFLYDKLEDILKVLLSKPQFEKIEIITNGTVSPSDDLLNIISGERCEITISNYGSISKKKNEIIQKCIEKGIPYKIDENFKWCSLGGHEKRNRKIALNQRLFKECRESKCNQILDGKLYICPRAAAGKKLGLFKCDKEEFVDLRKCDKKMMKRKLKQFYSQKVISTCDYCDGITSSSRKISPAEQMK